MLLMAAGWAALGATARGQLVTNAPRQLQLQVLDAASQQPLAGVRVRSWVRGEKESDTNGLCAIPLPAPKPGSFSYRLTLAKPGYVTEMVTWSQAQQDTNEDMPTNYVAHLAKGVGIGGWVKDEKGQPIPGAKIIFSGPLAGGVERERNVVAPNYHSERADEAGRWTNSEAPANFRQLVFRVGAADYRPATYACVTNEDDTNIVALPEQDFLAGRAVLTLGHGIVLAGRVLDPAGQPVPRVTVTKDYEWHNPAVTRETDSDGRFELSNLRAGEMVLTVQAADWAPQTVVVTLTNGLAPLTISLRPGLALKGRVVDETGQPISGARVQLDRAGRAPLEFDWSAETDAEGRFEWSAAPAGEYPYLIGAPGFHARSEPTWAAGGGEKTAVLRHEKEGDGVEADGIVTDGSSGQPVKKFTINLTEYRGTAVITSRQEAVSEAGHYRVEMDAKDDAYEIGVRAEGYLPADSDRSLTGDGDQSFDFQLARGVAHDVTGRFVVKNYNDWIDWAHDQEITFSPVAPKPPGLESEDALTEARLMHDFLRSSAGKKWRQAQRSLAVSLDAQGYFTIKDAAPGRYQLRAQVAQAGKPVGMASQEVAVGEAPLDLGVVEISARHELKAGDAAPAFAVKALDGGDLKLADFRGRYVLLDFWATWCGPCVAEMPNLKAAYDAFGGQCVMISLSLDQEAAAPRAFARKNGIKWRQGFLGEWSQTDVPNQYGVDGIPAIFLIGPDGKIVERGLRGPAIGEALKKALNPPN
jgi:peroxiredoxin/protocatechuate 3,4-dioxygenase beta subunit